MINYLRRRGNLTIRTIREAIPRCLTSPIPFGKKSCPTAFTKLRARKEQESAFTGKVLELHRHRLILLRGMRQRLVRSDAKFASTCGWPSFFETLRKNAVLYHPDTSYGMRRTEVTCGRCGAHLGHLFDDGPPPTGKRYCMNSIVLDFVPDDSTKVE